jgi:hypothetical protein
MTCVCTPRAICTPEALDTVTDRNSIAAAHAHFQTQKWNLICSHKVICKAGLSSVSINHAYNRMLELSALAEAQKQSNNMIRGVKKLEGNHVVAYSFPTPV